MEDPPPPPPPQSDTSDDDPMSQSPDATNAAGSVIEGESSVSQQPTPPSAPPLSSSSSSGDNNDDPQQQNPSVPPPPPPDHHHHHHHRDDPPQQHQHQHHHSSTAADVHIPPIQIPVNTQQQQVQHAPQSRPLPQTPGRMQHSRSMPHMQQHPYPPPPPPHMQQQTRTGSGSPTTPQPMTPGMYHQHPQQQHQYQYPGQGHVPQWSQQHTPRGMPKPMTPRMQHQHPQPPQYHQQHTPRVCMQHSQSMSHLHQQQQQPHTPRRMVPLQQKLSGSPSSTPQSPGMQNLAMLQAQMGSSPVVPNMSTVQAQMQMLTGQSNAPTHGMVQTPRGPNGSFSAQRQEQQQHQQQVKKKKKKKRHSFGRRVYIFHRRLLFYVLSNHVLFSVFLRMSFLTRMWIRLLLAIRGKNVPEEKRQEWIEKHKKIKDKFSTFRRLLFLIFFLISLWCCTVFVQWFTLIQNCSILASNRSWCSKHEKIYKTHRPFKPPFLDIPRLSNKFEEDSFCAVNISPAFINPANSDVSSDAKIDWSAEYNLTLSLDTRKTRIGTYMIFHNISSYVPPDEVDRKWIAEYEVAASSGYCLPICIEDGDDDDDDDNDNNLVFEDRPYCNDIGEKRHDAVVCLTDKHCEPFYEFFIIPWFLSTLISMAVFKPVRFVIKFILSNMGRGGLCYTKNKTVQTATRVILYAVMLAIVLVWIILAIFALSAALDAKNFGESFLNSILPFITSVITTLFLDIFLLALEYLLLCRGLCLFDQTADGVLDEIEDAFLALIDKLDDMSMKPIDTSLTMVPVVASR